MPSAVVAVTNVHRLDPTGPAAWGVSFYVAAYGVKGRLLVPVDCGPFTGANILKVARNQLRLFSGALADTTATYALTEQQIVKLRRDYQPNVFLR
jgi:hypothetical protein